MPSQNNRRRLAKFAKNTIHRCITVVKMHSAGILYK